MYSISTSCQPLSFYKVLSRQCFPFQIISHNDDALKYKRGRFWTPPQPTSKKRTNQNEFDGYWFFFLLAIIQTIAVQITESTAAPTQKYATEEKSYAAAPSPTVLPLWIANPLIASWIAAPI